MMKNIAFILLLLSAFFVGRAQDRNAIRANFTRSLNATVIVDSVEVNPDAISNIDPNNIDRIDVVKNTKYPNGVLYVTLKDHSKLANLQKENSFSLAQITDPQIANEDKQKSRIYILDGRLITDTTNVRVPANHYHKVTVTPESEMPYFKTALPNVLLIIISTIEPGTKIMLRGNSELR